MTLPIFVAQEQWQDFDAAWNQLMEADGPIADLLVALKLAGDKKRIPRCVPLVRQHVKKLEEMERFDDAAALLGEALLSGAAPAELAGPLMENAAKAWSDEPWWQRTLELTGLGSLETDIRRGWKAFRKLRAFQPGTIVFHPGGWGAGEIEEVREDQAELVVRFQNGRLDHFPLGAAVDIFDPLPEGDLRAQHFRDPEGLKQRLRKEPIEALRAIAERYHGRVSLAAIKNAMAQVGLDGSAWSAWWRKARKLAENDEWFRLSGNGARMEVRLLLTAADPVAQLERQLANMGALEPVLVRVRDLFSAGGADEKVRQLALQTVERLAADEGEALGLRLSAWMLLRQHRGQTPEPLAARLRAAAASGSEPAPGRAPGVWALFQELPSTRDQEAAIALLEEIYPEDWLDRACEHLPHAAPGMVRPLVERLLAAGREAELAEMYRRLLARPLSGPHALVALARLAETEKLPGEYPEPARRVQSLLSLATLLWAERRSDANLGRLHGRLVDLLAGGRPPLLERLLEGADPHTLRSVQLLIQRGVEESIDNIVASLVFHAGPEALSGVERPFWESDSIWTTRSGRERQSREYKELQDVKIPANEQAIARAASMGDLSENAEWDMALEEKRNLTERAAAMERDLLRAELLENATLPEDTVCPGTRVRYRELASGEELTITILGPWDMDRAEDVVSYRAPLAQGLLGSHSGEQSRLHLPSGEVEVEVIAIEPADID